MMPLGELGDFLGRTASPSPEYPEIEE